MRDGEGYPRAGGSPETADSNTRRQGNVIGNGLGNGINILQETHFPHKRQPNDLLSTLTTIPDLTMNDTTLSSSGANDNNLSVGSLDPLNFDAGSANLRIFDLSLGDIDSKQVLTLNDVPHPHTLSPNDMAKTLDIPDILNVLNDNDVLGNDDFIKLDMNMDVPISLSLDLNSENEMQSSKNNLSYISNPSAPQSIECLSWASYSNLDTPCSKILQNSDIPNSELKRSFTRLKQTSELINTEKVFICSLKILERMYLKNFISNNATPIYFQTFMECVSTLLRNHQKFYDNVIPVYNRWYRDSLRLLELDPKELFANSPNFDKYNYVSNEREYLETIMRHISGDAIDVDTYSVYCSLFSKVLNFARSHNIEQYKRDSLVILNDYLVEHENLNVDYFIDKHLDTRFISVIQMPTTRMIRYKLITQSLLKNIHMDEKDKLQIKFYEKILAKINVKIDSINSFVGNEEAKFEKLDEFKSLCLQNSNTNKNIIPNSLFFENLEDLQLASAFGIVSPSNTRSRITSEYLCGVLFKNHLILAKPSSLHSNSLDIKFIIPLMSIIDIGGPTYSLASRYSEVANIIFEDNFKIYEMSFIFPDEKEKLMWLAKLRINLEKLTPMFSNYKNLDFNFVYSDIQRSASSFGLSNGFDQTIVSSYLPSSIKPIKKLNKGEKSVDSDEMIVFDVEHFIPNSQLDSGKREVATTTITSPSTTTRGSITSFLEPPHIEDIENVKVKTKSFSNTLSNSTLTKYPAIKITLQERVAAQTCISNIWSNQFDRYTLSISITRSLSSLFHSKRTFFSAANTPSTPNANQFIPPSPSFANKGDLSNASNSNYHSTGSSLSHKNGILGSPIKLRHSYSMRSLKDKVTLTNDPIETDTVTPKTTYLRIPVDTSPENLHSPYSKSSFSKSLRTSASLKSLSSFVKNSGSAAKVGEENRQPCSPGTPHRSSSSISSKEKSPRCHTGDDHGSTHRLAGMTKLWRSLKVPNKRS